jgi:endoglucanase
VKQPIGINIILANPDTFLHKHSRDIFKAAFKQTSCLLLFILACMKTLASCLLIAIINQTLLAQSTTDKISVNQAGFYPIAPKMAVVVGEPSDKAFYIISTDGKDTAFTGVLGEVMSSKNSSLKTRAADFSKLQKQGNYVVNIPTLGSSYPFKIEPNVLHTAAVASLKGYYYQRLSMPLEPKYAGKWARPAGRPDNQVLVHSSAATNQRPTGTVISSSGGWLDAGDYNKYIVNSGITMGTLLSAYEDFPAYYKKLNTNIPESGDAIPDLLNEILYNLRWMLTMQDPNDGGIYHKCTNADFDGMVMPDATTLPRYVVQKGTAATLDFTAVMAQASRIFAAYGKQLPGLSDSCISAARYAWDWAVKNPAVEYNQNAMNRMMHKPPINTGAYGDKNFVDEWFWASAELYISTNDETYYKQIARDINVPLTLPTWNNVAALGVYSLIRAAKQIPATHAADIETLKKSVLRLADSYRANVAQNAFHTIMGQTVKDFNWGSNSNAANQGIVLVNAYLISTDRKYINDALTNIDYILGRNATGYCFLTGIGTKSTMHPHHRPSVADGVLEPVPGLLAGGPNPGKQDSCQYEFSEPETAYTDSDCSYASNEIAINWNAPLVYLANALEALQFEVVYALPPKKK